MNTATDTVKSFYQKLQSGDAPGALSLMSADIEWKTLEGWPYKPKARGPLAVASDVLTPMMSEWNEFSIDITEIIPAGMNVLVLGAYVGRHKTTGKNLRAGLAHLWDVASGKLVRFRGYADTAAIAAARM